MSIAVLYVCTGNYQIFWNSFYKEAREFFYPRHEKCFFVFTDSEELIKNSKEMQDVRMYFQRRSGWPYDTLMRFNTFCTIQDILQEFDYCYFWNANAHFLKTVDQNIIPFPDQEKPLVMWRHTGKYLDEYGDTFDVERNPISCASIPFGEKCYAYGGGFFGGTSEAFIAMSCELRDRIAKDLEAGFIAKWHDQSHLQRYASSKSCVEVPEFTIMSEEYVGNHEPYVIFLDKEHFGGMGKLRNMTLQQRAKIRVQKWIKYIYLNTALGKVIRKFKNKRKST